MIQENIPLSIYKSYLSVKFEGNPRLYYFGLTEDLNLQINDPVIVETLRGLELGYVASETIEIKNYKSDLGLKPVIRRADENDLRVYEVNKKDALIALEICKTEVKKLDLQMNLISCEYTLDKAKVLFSYLADDRVDFRELLKVLASRLHTRIDLRQIGPRDKAKSIGGIGVCGLPICCSNFLNEFDGISIGRAKNQMLAINIPKLSGQCGKLMCCLKFEDDMYTEEKKRFPELGSKCFVDKVEYTVTGINIISNSVKIENPEDIKFVQLSELKKIAYFPKKKKENETK